MEKHAQETFSSINPIVVPDLQKYYPAAWILFQQFKGEFLVRILEGLLKRGIEEGYSPPKIDVKIMAIMRVNQIEAGFDTNLFPMATFDLWEVQSQFLTHFNYGLCTIEQLNQTRT